MCIIFLLQIVCNKSNNNILIDTIEEILNKYLLCVFSKASTYTRLPNFIGQWLTQQGFSLFVSVFSRMQHVLKSKTNPGYCHQCLLVVLVPSLSALIVASKSIFFLFQICIVTCFIFGIFFFQIPLCTFGKITDSFSS